MSLCHLIPQLSRIDFSKQPYSGQPLTASSPYYKTFRAIQLAFSQLQYLDQGEQKQQLPKNELSRPVKLELARAFDPVTQSIFSPPVVTVYAPVEFHEIRKLFKFAISEL